MSTQFRTWIQAARLKTLPLAASAIFLGAGLAVQAGEFRPLVFALSLLTALLLQVLSNLANDYGDAVSGADNEDRVGPQRVVQAGLISKEQMKRALIAVVIATVASGLTLLLVACWEQPAVLFGFLGLGLACIWAAMAYTMGKRPYGYQGLGDLFVFLFFGLVAVLGSGFLHQLSIRADWLLPAISAGLLATSVLNINNVRDLEGDKRSGKFTLAVRLGRERALRYHSALLLGASLTALGYLAIHGATWQLLPQLLMAFPLWALNQKVRQNADKPEVMNRLLPATAGVSLLHNLVLALGACLL